jgi:hypothetical protein
MEHDQGLAGIKQADEIARDIWLGPLGGRRDTSFEGKAW